MFGLPMFRRRLHYIITLSQSFTGQKSSQNKGLHRCRKTEKFWENFYHRFRDLGDRILMLVTSFEYWCATLYMLVTKNVSKILYLSETHFIPSILYLYTVSNTNTQKMSPTTKFCHPNPKICDLIFLNIAPKMFDSIISLNNF